MNPDGAALEPGEVGEVAARGPNFGAGYEAAPEPAGHAFRNGWYHTGDLGHLDTDGHLFLTGRLKQLINRGGEKVNPQEVDDVLLAHPAVAQAACFAVKHPTLGEDVVAAAVLKPLSTVSEADLRAFLAGRLTSFKAPRRIRFLARPPHNAVGKIDRLLLSELAGAGMAG